MAELEKYFVSEDCIACDACCDDFPDIFKMNAEHTRAYAANEAPVGKFNPWDIVTVCPVDAISLVNLPMPPKPAGMEGPKKEEVLSSDLRDWRKRWEEVQDKPEPQWERMKRYGMASSIADNGDHYTLKFELPEFIPNHELKFKWGLPDKMPDYHYQVDVVDGNAVKVRGKLEDENVRKLCGWVNSFPSGFLKEFSLGQKVKDHKEKYDPETKILEVTLAKA